MQFEFTADVWFWQGPSPFYFVSVPAKQCGDLKAISGLVTYGWGMIPAIVRIGKTEWKTSLWPKDGGYIVPLKVVVRRSENINDGDNIVGGTGIICTFRPATGSPF